MKMSRDFQSTKADGLAQALEMTFLLCNHTEVDGIFKSFFLSFFCLNNVVWLHAAFSSIIMKWKIVLKRPKGKCA